MERKIGMMCRGNVVHLAVRDHVTQHNGQPWQLYRAACQRISYRHITYLLPTTRREVTCKRCLARVVVGDTFVSITNTGQ